MFYNKSSDSWPTFETWKEMHITPRLILLSSVRKHTAFVHQIVCPMDEYLLYVYLLTNITG